MTTRILCVGDLHLGRRPSRYPTGSSPDDLGPAAAWRRCVEAAMRRRVHAVLLAGDVVERIEDRFAAFDLLRRGVEDLTRAGIAVVGITGNHDVKALPRLADLLPSFRLLGRDATWEEITLDTPDPVTVAGWSFRERHHHESPLADFPTRRSRGAVRIGLLHADLDVSGSRYAPITSSELEAADADAFLLGHVHTPSALHAKTPRGYLGSVVALDPSETGPHGPWLLEIDGGRIAFEHLPLAPLRFEHRDVDVSDGDLLGAMTNAMRLIEEECAGDELGAAAIGLRARLVGSVRSTRDVARAVAELRESHLEHTGSRATVFVDKVTDATAPAVDLAARAERDDYPGLVARRLVAIDGGDEAGERVLAGARRALADEWTRLADRLGLKDVEVDDDLLRRCLARAGNDLVAALVEQIGPEALASGALGTNDGANAANENEPGSDTP